MAASVTKKLDHNIASSVMIKNCKVISKIENWVFVIFMIISGIVLDKKSYFKYKYVHIIFENGNETEAIQCEDIKKEGNWLIVSSEQKGEVHYRLKDIKAFRYVDRSYIKI